MAYNGRGRERERRVLWSSIKNRQRSGRVNCGGPILSRRGKCKRQVSETDGEGNRGANAGSTEYKAEAGK